jgi:glycosidase
MTVRPSLPFAAFVALAAALLAGCATAPMLPPTDTSPVAQADPGSPLPEGWQNGAFMEILVRGYQDSDGDGIGDLKGLTQRLDYLKELGVKGLWLMPVTQSADHDHGYAVLDFRTIERGYGTLADFDEFIRQAHARGIGVIMDYVLNHASQAHPMFVHGRAFKDSPWRDWFVWQDTMPRGWDIWGKNPWYAAETGAFFATFGPQMPDFNLRNPATLHYHFDSLRFWLNRGLDGFRFDAVPHLVENGAAQWNDQPESEAIMGQVNRLVHGYRNRHLVCEATATPEKWALPRTCGSAFAFGFERHVAPAALGDAKAIQAVSQWFATHPLSMATMVSNHDIFAGKRLYNQVQGDLAAYKLAAATYLLMPGTPFIYYGEEVGMAGGVWPDGGEPEGDLPLRTPMSWTAEPKTAGFTSGTPFRFLSANAARFNAAAQQAEPDGLLAFYKAMIRLRNTLPSIARGSYEQPFVDGLVMGYQRRFDKEHSVVLINYAKQPARVSVKALPAHARLASAFPASFTAAADASGQAAISVPAQSVQVWKVLP